MAKISFSECELIKYFDSEYKLRKHQRKVHCEEDLKCEECPKKFHQKYRIRRHFETVHQNININRVINVERVKVMTILKVT